MSSQEASILADLSKAPAASSMQASILPSSTSVIDLTGNRAKIPEFKLQSLGSSVATMELSDWLDRVKKSFGAAGADIYLTSLAHSENMIKNRPYETRSFLSCRQRLC